MSNEKFSEKMGDAMLDPRNNRIWKGLMWLLVLLLWVLRLLVLWLLILRRRLREVARLRLISALRLVIVLLLVVVTLLLVLHRHHAPLRLIVG